MACDCSDLEDKICTLSEELAAAEGCAGVVTRDADGGSRDHSGKITMKQAALKTYILQVIKQWKICICIITSWQSNFFLS